MDDRSTYNHYRTSLNALLDKIDQGSEQAVQNAVRSAIEEKGRYIAERIARTEAARARYDAFVARYGEDDSVAAYQWKLGSRHPAEDICDMYAHADLYGLGRGVFPKDQAPVNPAHPHCLCHYAPVYASELKGKKQPGNVEDRGNSWLKQQPLHIRQAILGVKGEQEWKAGRVGWMEKARNLNLQIGSYYGVKSRLHIFARKIIEKVSEPKALRNLPKLDENFSIEENAIRTNPNFHSEKKGAEYYRYNCQKCVPAFELRMRGYDVRAKWYDQENRNSNEDWLERNPFSAFRNAEIKTVPTSTSAYDRLFTVLQEYGTGARIEIAYNRYGVDFGHVIVGYNNMGKIGFMDVQEGIPFTLEKMDGIINVKYARIDTLDFNDSFLADICEWRPK